jgi:hypothetical protein
MAKTALLTRRLGTIQATIGERRITHLIQQIADRLNMDPGDLRREADHLVQCFVEVGATTNAAKLTHVANDLSMSEADLLCELRADPVTGYLWRD